LGNLRGCHEEVIKCSKMKLSNPLLWPFLIRIVYENVGNKKKTIKIIKTLVEQCNINFFESPYQLCDQKRLLVNQNDRNSLRVIAEPAL